MVQESTGVLQGKLTPILTLALVKGFIVECRCRSSYLAVGLAQYHLINFCEQIAAALEHIASKQVTKDTTLLSAFILNSVHL